MYKNSYDTSLRDETRFAKKMFIWLAAFAALCSVIGWFVTRGTSVVETGILRYEEYHEMYNTCKKIDEDLATIRAIADTDRYFASFSKEAMIAQKRQQLTRWAEEYNAKSKMWTRSIWKTDTLPYQLDVNNFPNYNDHTK